MEGIDMTNTMKEENKKVITGRQIVEYLLLVALALIVFISLSTAVILISTTLFNITGVDAVALGGKIGILVWMVSLGFLTVSTIKNSRS